MPPAAAAASPARLTSGGPSPRVRGLPAPGRQDPTRGLSPHLAHYAPATRLPHPLPEIPRPSRAAAYPVPGRPASRQGPRLLLDPSPVRRLFSVRQGCLLHTLDLTKSETDLA
ncbi:hypothetical protein NCCP1664_19110 [Zafaria cholistanensis]|uniref:Uncharacterized protein n=1 Tax=Zafaria cholistanensis TaxID=1682741 RepID=A0A5A7NRN4_9MICC|nr:hypothetical protein NCCP1664_19110 [Zafaria cholistanensis]